MEENCGGGQGLNWAVKLRREREHLQHRITTIQQTKNNTHDSNKYKNKKT
jgi:hypothetical protein